MTDIQINSTTHLGPVGPSDGQRRRKRVEFRVTQAEYDTVKQLALAGKFASTAQYVRENALNPNDAPTERHGLLVLCQGELNRIAAQIDDVSRSLIGDRPIDEEALMVLLQIQDLATESFKSVSAKVLA